MTINVNEAMFYDTFIKMGRANQFSYNALNELFNYYEGLEEETGEPIELDVIAICCDWDECDPSSMIDNYGYLVEREEDQDDEDYATVIAEYIKDNKSVVIEVGSYNWLVMNF